MDSDGGSNPRRGLAGEKPFLLVFSFGKIHEYAARVTKNSALQSSN
jgi:hypothetical protein